MIVLYPSVLFLLFAIAKGNHANENCGSQRVKVLSLLKMGFIIFLKFTIFIVKTYFNMHIIGSIQFLLFFAQWQVQNIRERRGANR